MRTIVGICILLSAVGAFAQVLTEGRLSGTVTDAQGALIVAAKIDVQAADDRYSALTDKLGKFSIFPLAPGVYDVKVSAPGFATELCKAVQVRLNESVTLNPSLRLARTTSEVVVSGEVPQVRTDSAELEHILDARTIGSLPLPTRNLLQLLS